MRGKGCTVASCNFISYNEREDRYNLYGGIKQC